MPPSLPPASLHPPVPSYIFRGHHTAIHALHFFASNKLFASGDSEGSIVIWRLTNKRAAAAWKAHDGGILGIKDCASGTQLITQGRDHKVRVWRVGEEDLAVLSARLPVDGAGVVVDGDDRQPWLVHSMDVGALNFCAFGICEDPSGQEDGVTGLLLAVPNGLDDGGVDVFQLPSEQRVSKIQSDRKTNTGMVMCLRVFYNVKLGRLMLVVGYEDGQVAVYARKKQNVMPAWIWERFMLARPHKQPVLSLDVTADQMYFITSSADAVVAKFAMPEQITAETEPVKTNNTKHAGQQDLKIRSDGRIFATAGWDKQVRVYSTKSLKELAVLQWHQEGCYAVAFAGVHTDSVEETPDSTAVTVSALEKLKHDRDDKIHNTHWLVAGSKDGKISLWDVY